MLVRPVGIAGAADQGFEPRPGTLLVTDDGDGVARELVRRLQDRGQQVRLLCWPGANGVRLSGEHVAVDLTSPAAVDSMFADIGQRLGEIAGILHLLPLGSPPAHEDWHARMCREVKSLFLLARGLARQMERGDEGQGKLLLAATAMGGSFGVGGGPLPASFFPGQGGVAGLVKSLAHEWPAALVRVVDFPSPAAPEALASRLVAELADGDGPVEVGYADSQRVTLQCAPAPLEGHNGSPPLDPQSTILVTGGARGITAAIALELARRYRPRLALVGRAPLPAENELPQTADLSDPAQLKAALLAQLGHGNGRAAPAEVEKAYRELLRDREIRANLASFRQSGAEVQYFQADVRDADAFAATVRRIQRAWGGIDAVIHGAGVIDDRLIGDKTPESYDYVFGTKLNGALNLSRLVDPERLKFCALFASVAGRFGNRGQTDYAAANEALSKLAMYLDERWPGRVVSIVWGPWSRIGMVSELEGHLSRRGLELIPPELGPQRFDEELRYGRKGDSEVVIAGDVGQLRCPGRAQPELVAEAVG
jgi:NAD(P)-dependent dehydrogenase (short-subunit alcohol dehydrogenase family)